MALNSGEYLRWVRRFEYLGFSEVLSIVSTIKFVDTILQEPDANLNMTLLDAYLKAAMENDELFAKLDCLHLEYKANEPVPITNSVKAGEILI